MSEKPDLSGFSGKIALFYFLVFLNIYLYLSTKKGTKKMKAHGYILDSTKETTIRIDENGQEQTTVIEKVKKRERSTEPDYIKLYTSMWCEFNQIPLRARPLFLELVVRMGYADKSARGGGQLVGTGGPIMADICEKLGSDGKALTRSTYQKYLKDLVNCGAIIPISRGYYQISGDYAGKGEWRYNPTLKRGGVEELTTTFRMRSDGTKQVETNILWADDGTDTEINNTYRKMTNAKKDEQTVMTTTTATPIEDNQDIDMKESEEAL